MKLLSLCLCTLALAVWGCGSDPSADPAKKPKDGGTDAAGVCGSGALDCDGLEANGCEVDGEGDEENCGACGVSCGLSHAQASCQSGSCQLDACDTDYANCDGDASNGCEVFLAGEPHHCGLCGNVCPTASPSCTDGKCVASTCTPPLGDCDGDASNGCETTLNDDPNNCGACNNACDYPHAAPDCEQSACAMGPCDANYANCDSVDGNGCEIDTQTSTDHCGACNAACGSANGTASCQAGLCQLVCSTGFENCDGQKANGCETNLTSDPNNCAGCGNVCPTPPIGVAACVAGVCNVATCPLPLADCDGLLSTGCEVDTSSHVLHCGGCNAPCPTPANASAACSAGSCGIGSCSGAFENCNGQASDGCEIDTDSNPAHCGGCNAPCTFPNANSTCNAGSCGLGSCNGGFSNCNATAADGCEINTATDVNNCGACGTSCAAQFPNASVACNGSCSFVGCNAGFYDIDNNTANGCEYACTFSSATDLPDDGFVDANCDGIDGDVSVAVFVATSGNDSNPGTKQLPMATVTGGVGRAVLTGKTQVYVSNGTYVARVTLMNGISIYGGYSASNGWIRSASFVATIQSGTVTNGYVAALDGSNVTSITTVDRLTIRTLNTTSAGVSNYAFRCTGCSGVRLKNSIVDAGNGGGGTAGSSGAAGSNGGPGNGGLAGSCDNNSAGGAGGPGGTSACGRTGGNGGKGGDYGVNNGFPGAIGVIGTPGGSGGGGGDPGGDGGNGQPGSNGAAGTSGPGGSGGIVSSGLWTANAGAGGGIGTHGNGGGGGGGGGGQGCFFCDDGPGNGGGGGGGAGCAGGNATGGTGGGGSFGLFLVGSTGIQLTNNNISSGNGGNGGAGGSGGGGGIGANGGQGGTTCTSEVGQGGNGGKGGNGGLGGHGGGGAGGASYAIYRSGTSVATAGNVLGFGTPGMGGSSSGNAGSTGGSGNVF